MCGFETSSKIPRGFNTFKSFGLLITLMSMVVRDTRGNGSSTTERPTITGRLAGTRCNLARIKTQMDVSNNGEVLVGHSGDPWGFHNETEQDSRTSKTSSKSGLSNVGISARRRPRRSVVHLYNMVVCATGCNPVSYKGYGCYCGFLGSGTAVDGIDQCCRMHDRCYDATECPTFLEYFVPYYWKCYRGYRPICAVEHGKWGGSGSCAQRLCECDRALSECLRRFPCPTSKAVCTTSPWRLIQNVFMIF